MTQNQKKELENALEYVECKYINTFKIRGCALTICSIINILIIAYIIFNFSKIQDGLISFTSVICLVFGNILYYVIVSSAMHLYVNYILKKSNLFKLYNKYCHDSN